VACCSEKRRPKGNPIRFRPVALGGRTGFLQDRGGKAPIFFLRPQFPVHGKVGNSPLTVLSDPCARGYRKGDGVGRLQVLSVDKVQGVQPVKIEPQDLPKGVTEGKNPARKRTKRKGAAMGINTKRVEF
jgi:hypothetical protein